MISFFLIQEVQFEKLFSLISSFTEVDCEEDFFIFGASYFGDVEAGDDFDCELELNSLIFEQWNVLKFPLESYAFIYALRSGPAYTKNERREFLFVPTTAGIFETNSFSFRNFE